MLWRGGGGWVRYVRYMAFDWIEGERRVAVLGEGGGMHFLHCVGCLDISMRHLFVLRFFLPLSIRATIYNRGGFFSMV